MYIYIYTYTRACAHTHTRSHSIYTCIVYFSVFFSDQNIICTSRDRWHVNSTINDEYVRNKIICILLDSFCNEFLEYAFFLFQFLLKDQSSYYNPIGKINSYICIFIFINYIFVIVTFVFFIIYHL